VFRRYKAYLRRAYQAKQLRASSQDVTAVDLIRILLEIIRHVLQGIVWEKSFADNGYTLHQVNTCHRIRDLLPNLVVPTLPDSEFCFADICSVLPRKRGYDRNLLWPETWPEIQAHEDPVLVDVSQRETDPMQASQTSEYEASLQSAFAHPDELCADSIDSWYTRLRPRHNRSAASSSAAPIPEETFATTNLASVSAQRCQSSSSATRLVDSQRPPSHDRSGSQPHCPDL
jgi:hypothetical protein